MAVNGCASIRGCITRWRVKLGAAGWTGIRDWRAASGGATSGGRSSPISGPLQGTEKAASASATSEPSRSMRPERVLSERPARSVTVRIVTGPGSGARA